MNPFCGILKTRNVTQPCRVCNLARSAGFERSMRSRLATHPLRLRCLLLSLLLTTTCTGSSADVSPIDQQAIRGHLEKIVSFGPHPPGSPAQASVGDYLIAELKSFGLQVEIDEFEPVTPMGRLKMRNIWGVVPGKTNRIIILASHYDSKYFKDFKFVGANDGGSSSALVLELARILAKQQPDRFHDLVHIFRRRRSDRRMDRARQSLRQPPIRQDAHPTPAARTPGGHLPV